jgi:ABC-2 type transport system ATP-binding protein
VIATSGLSKDYGSGRGLFDLDLDVQPGEVSGFLGRRRGDPRLASTWAA